ncbi:MAG: hypothetical protein M1827_002862 [Pycnora praestabilis]|nr:MAG: hypothetical protein M1827_002862 [Pycnora praestabilis]
MAPMDQTSAPLASYFFIAGVDSLSYGEHLQTKSSSGEKISNGAILPPVSSTIAEDEASETEETSVTTSPANTPNHRRGDSFQRLSRLSNEARLSIQSITALESRASDSNRSSATIKGIQLNPGGLNEVDFDKALRKFASERESFMEELSINAGMAVANRPKPRPRTQRMANEDVQGLKAGGGSVRRRISFKDMQSLKRQPSVARQSSVRTSKRLSNYNSVIPAPQPLNSTPNMHPLKRRFEPVLLDRYPPKSMVEETKRRGPFPDYVPMFAFPNDINIVSADVRPRSTWHGFAMTSSDNSRLYAICLIMWMPMNPDAAAEVEERCEEWRRDNMTNEERELAGSLGERLATERAKLSRLLAKLPSVTSGSTARDALEDEISAVEEKIGLMTDLLRPVRHGAAAKIDGLTDGETGLWVPRAYGVLGKDPNLTSFWKEWLRAVAVPMTNGGVLRVPPSSPKIGTWQPLERYVVNLCAEALSPISSKTQVEIAIRELRLFARKEAINEIPGSRNTDLYALFRALSIQNIVTLFEFALSESRIIFLSSHTAMLHLASKALACILYPLTWAGVFIPVLPARLLLALEAPCPYIVGIERRYEKIELPEDDFVLVDLDQDEIESVGRSTPLPRQQRRKLVSLLQLAAPHHNRYGVPIAPPAYAIESFPFDAFSSENPSIFTPNAPVTTLSKFVSLTSSAFGDSLSNFAPRPPVFNAFLQSKSDQSRAFDRPSTSSTNKGSSPPSPRLSPTSTQFPPLPTTPISRNDSGFSLQATLREKRSGHFDVQSRRSSSYGFERIPTLRRPSLPFNGHSASLSTSTVATDNNSSYRYAPSSYATSTLAASTVMPNMLMQPVRDTDTTSWIEGHCLQWRPKDEKSTCSVCDDKAEDGIYKCAGCDINAHGRCAPQLCVVCPAAFHPEQIRAAFVRCFASLFYTYRKYLQPAAADQKKTGMVYQFNMDGFMKSLPRENAEYMHVLQQTQGFNEFIYERECKRPNDPAIMLFDQIILSKKNRGRTSFFSKSSTDFLSDTSDHLWRSAAATPPNSRFPGDYRQVVSRIPAKLDPLLMKEPRVIQGVPRISTAKAKRKPIPSLLGPGMMNGLAHSPH